MGAAGAHEVIQRFMLSPNTRRRPTIGEFAQQYRLTLKQHDANVAWMTVVAGEVEA